MGVSFVVNSTRLDKRLDWFTDAQYNCLYAHIIHTLDDWNATQFITLLHTVHTYVSRECMNFGITYAGIRDAVILSLTANLRNAVSQHLFNNMSKSGVVSTPISNVSNTRDRNPYPNIIKLWCAISTPLSMTQRRRLFRSLAKLLPFISAQIPNVGKLILHVETMFRKKCQKRFPGWTLVRVLVGPQSVQGYQQLAEDPYDTFRISTENDGLTHRGDKVTALVSDPIQFPLRLVHDTYADEHRSQFNFMIDLPFVFVLRHSSGCRKAFSIPVSIVDLTMFDRDGDWGAVRSPSVHREYRIAPQGLTVRSLSPLGWCLREAALGNAARAGVFFAFSWIEESGCDKDAHLRALDRLCHAVHAALPARLLAYELRKVNAIVAEMRSDQGNSRPLTLPPAHPMFYAKNKKTSFSAPDAFAHDFYAALRTVADAAIASHVLDHAPLYGVTYVTPDSMQDTFY